MIEELWPLEAVASSDDWNQQVAPDTPWMTPFTTNQVQILMQFDLPVHIVKIDFVNENAAFIEVSVAAVNKASEYRVLLQQSTLRTFPEVQHGKNPNRHVVYDSSKLHAQTAEGSWSFVRFRLSQPFNPAVKLGWRSVKLYGNEVVTHSLHDSQPAPIKIVESPVTSVALPNLFSQSQTLSMAFDEDFTAIKRPALEASEQTQQKQTDQMEKQSRGSEAIDNPKPSEIGKRTTERHVNVVESPSKQLEVKQTKVPAVQRIQSNEHSTSVPKQTKEPLHIEQTVSSVADEEELSVADEMAMLQSLLPALFEGIRFKFGNDLTIEERKIYRRYLRAYGAEQANKSDKQVIVFSRKSTIEDAQGSINPQWIVDCHDSLSRLSFESYRC